MKTASDLLQRYRSLRLLISLLVIITALFAFGLVWSVLALFSDVILLFFLAWIISFILEPASLFLQNRGLPRALAVTLIYLALLIVIFSAVVLTVPIIAQQVLRLTGEVANTVSDKNLSTLRATLVGLLEHFGLSPTDANSAASQFSDQIPIWAGNAEQQAFGAATGLLTSVVGILFNVVLITIISFYMMLDGDRLVESFVERLPRSWLPDVRLFQENVQRIFGGFFRAQMIIGALYGALTWLMLVLLGATNGLLVALLSGAVMLLPFIGPFLAIIPPVFLLLLETPSDQVAVKVLILLVLLVLAQQLVMQVLAPRIFGDSMGVHPLLLFAALLIGAKLGGAWGAFFAAPICALVCATLDVFYTRFAKESPMFQSDAEAAAEADHEESAAEVVIPDPGASSHRIRVPLGAVHGLYGAPSRSEPRMRNPQASLAPHPRAVDSHLESHLESHLGSPVESHVDSRAEPQAATEPSRTPPATL